jgi:hypothetical protein
MQDSEKDFSLNDLGLRFVPYDLVEKIQRLYGNKMIDDALTLSTLELPQMAKKSDSEELLQWIAKGLEKPGKNRSGLARALGINPSQITKMMDGKRRIQNDEIPIIAAYIEEPAPGSTAPAIDYGLPIVAEAAADLWFKADSFDGRAISGKHPKIPPVPEFIAIPQFAVKMTRNGVYAICVHYWQARQAATSGDLVLVERKQGALVEASIRRLYWFPEKRVWRLIPDIGDDTQEEINLGGQVSDITTEIDDFKVKIIGRVIAEYHPLGFGP